MRRAIRFSRFGALLGLLLSMPVGVAQAQSTATTLPTGFAVSRFEPTAAGEYSFAVDHPWYSATRSFAAGLTFDYAHNPLLIGQVASDGSFSQSQQLIGNLLYGHVDLAGSFADRVLIAASLPVVLYDSGALSGGASVGDPRLGFLVRALGQPYQSAFSLSLGAQAWVPLRAFGDSVRQKIPATDSDGQVRVLPKIVLGGVWSRLLWSVTAGFLYRQEAAVDISKLSVSVAPDLAGRVGSEVQLGVGLSYYDAVRRFAIGPELLAAVGVTPSNPSSLTRYGTSVEALLTGHYNIARLVQVGAAAGLGFVRQPGTPDFRAMLRFAYAPLAAGPKDSDGDGIPDSEDACVHEKGLRTGNPITHGCPPAPADRDHDGVSDRQDLCPDVAQGISPDPNRPGCPGPVKPKVVEDRDGDGVPDRDDLCPDVPKGAQPDPNRSGCPAQDSDKDGVIDPIDQCLFDAAGLFPDPARPGCPLPDRDGDGIPDPSDACPDKAGAPSPFPKRNGCPGLVEVKNGQIVILRPVFFAPDQDLILAKSFPVLQAVAEALEAVPSIKHLVIEGHTDSQGKFATNLELSDRRAKSVKTWLVGKGINANRLEGKGYGQTRPIASNKTGPGRAKNRRVEFHIIEAASSSPAGDSDKPTDAKPGAEPAAAEKPVVIDQPALEPPASESPAAVKPPVAKPAVAKPAGKGPAAKGPAAKGAIGKRPAAKGAAAKPGPAVAKP